MKVLKVKDKRIAQRLTERLIRKGKVVALVERQEDTEKVKGRAHVVVVVKSKEKDATLSH